jgi:hypothetical protein
MRKEIMSLGTLLVLISLGSSAVAADHDDAPWVTSWATSPMPMQLKEPVSDSTIRNVVHLSLGGSSVRVTLTNQFGTAPLRVGSAHMALSAGGSKRQAGADHQLTFNHQTSISIPARSYVLSDPIQMQFGSFSDIAISLYLPQQTITAPTCHQWALSTNYVAAGDQASEAELHGARTMTSWCFLQSVTV